MNTVYNNLVINHRSLRVSIIVASESTTESKPSTQSPGAS